MSVKAVIFDLDGTLYEPSHFALRLIAANPFKAGMLARERKCRKSLKGREFPDAQGYYSTLFSLMAKGNGAKAERCRDWFWNCYMPLQARIIRKCFDKRPGFVELLRELRSKSIKTAVLSDYGMVQEKLAACGLDSSLFDGIWESPALGGLKPCPRVFEEACRMLGVKPCEALMVGDRCDTDGGALSAGLQFIHLIPSAGLPDTGAAAGSSCAGSSCAGSSCTGSTSPGLEGAGSAARLSTSRSSCAGSTSPGLEDADRAAAYGTEDPQRVEYSDAPKASHKEQDTPLNNKFAEMDWKALLTFLHTI